MEKQTFAQKLTGTLGAISNKFSAVIGDIKQEYIEDSKTYTAQEFKAGVSLFLQGIPYKESLEKHRKNDFTPNEKRLKHWECLAHQELKETIDKYDIHVILENMFLETKHPDPTQEAHDVMQYITNFIDDKRQTPDSNMTEALAENFDKNTSLFVPDINQHLVDVNPDGSLDNHVHIH